MSEHMDKLNREFQKMLEEEVDKFKKDNKGKNGTIKVVIEYEDGREETVAKGTFLMGAMKQGEDMEESGIVIAGNSRPSDLMIMKYILNKVLDDVIEQDMVGGI